MRKRISLISVAISCVLLIQIMTSGMVGYFGLSQVNAETESSLPIGDVDGNGNVNSLDFAYMRMVLLGLRAEFPVEDVLWASDVTGDGKFNSIDFAYMRMYLLSIIDEFPKQKMIATPTTTVTPTLTVTPTSTKTATPTVTLTPKVTITPTEPAQTIDPKTNDVARNKIAICSSYIGDGFEADKAVDGVLNSIWTAEGFGQWVRIDLGNEYDINKTEFLSGATKAYKYKIEASMDDENYSVVVDKTKNISASDTYIDSFTDTKARFVRLTVTGIEGSTSGNISIKELNVYRTEQAPLPTILPSPSPIIVTDYIRPYVTMSLNSEKVSVNGSVQITVAATDDVGVKTKTLKVNGSPVTLNEQGIATYMPKTPEYIRWNSLPRMKLAIQAMQRKN